MLSLARKRVKELEKEDLCGFIFKNGSPSSVMERVKVHNEKGMPEKKGWGCLPGRSWIIFLSFRWRRKAGFTIQE